MKQEDIVTVDLSRFGGRELRMATELLVAYRDQGAEFLDDGITLNFNSHSGCVFLSDEYDNVGMMNGDKLEQWFSCPECGHEGFAEDMMHEEDNPECQWYLDEAGILEANRS